VKDITDLKARESKRAAPSSMWTVGSHENLPPPCHAVTLSEPRP